MIIQKNIKGELFIFYFQFFFFLSKYSALHIIGVPRLLPCAPAQIGRLDTPNLDLLFTSWWCPQLFHINMTFLYILPTSKFSQKQMITSELYTFNERNPLIKVNDVKAVRMQPLKLPHWKHGLARIVVCLFVYYLFVGALA